MNDQIDIAVDRGAVPLARRGKLSMGDPLPVWEAVALGAITYLGAMWNLLL